MNLHNINTIARFEVKLLKRSWLFRIFAIVALLFLTIVQLSNLSPTFFAGMYVWNNTALSSLIPFFATYYYSIAQSIIVVFLAGNFLKRDKKLDTAEVIYVRPMSNADYIVGKVWGIIRVFIGLNLIVLGIGLFINLGINQSPFSIIPYLFYVLTISLPSLLFVLGLSFTAMCVLKNQAVTFIVMLGIVGTIFFYLPEKLYGVFDFFGVHIPSIFSDVAGLPNMNTFLLQRSIYLLLGIGFICLTITLVKRLPQRPWKTKLLYVVSVIIIFIAIGLGFLYVEGYKSIGERRNEFVQVFNKYADDPKAHIHSHDLVIEEKNGMLEGQSNLILQNVHYEKLDKIILYLNPDLDVISININGANASFEREEQVIIIDKSLLKDEEAKLVLHYKGNINEYICYTDVEDESYFEHTTSGMFFKYGKKYAYLEDKYTLLTPETIWYPVSESPVNPASPYKIRKDFTNYTLTVNNPKNKTIISQGDMKEEGEKIIFTNKTPLPAISLTIGDYEKKSITVDSTLYEVYYFKGHDFFSKYFNALQDTLPVVIKDIRNDIEVKKNTNYSFSKFLMVETPVQFNSYFRNWKGYTEQVMPEIVFIPERGLSTSADFRALSYWMKNRGRRGEEREEDEIQIDVLRNYINGTFNTASWNSSDGTQVNKLNINPMFFGFTRFIYSSSYPILDVVINTMQSTENNTRYVMWWGGNAINDEARANMYLQNHSFEEAVSDSELKPGVFYELLKLKSNYLKYYILTHTTEEKLNEFFKEFNNNILFTEVSWNEFLNKLESRFGISLDEFIASWYKVDRSPTILLKDADANMVLVDDFTKYQIKLRAYNPSNVDGLITVNVAAGGGGPGGGRGGFGGGFGGGSQSANVINHYIIPSFSAREIKIVSDDRPGRVTVNTNISHNLPTEFTFNFSKVDNEISDTTSGSFAIDTLIFAPDPTEFIIDNESSGFSTTDANQKRKLKDLFQKEDEDKYKNFIAWSRGMPSRWTPIIRNNCYGESIRSAVYKRKGKGGYTAEWKAEIPNDDYYEVFVWVPKMETFRMGGPRGRGGGRRSNNHTYTIKYGEEEERQEVDMEQEENGWVSLGSFYFPKGEASVTLTDKVSGDYVIADAVKFTLLKNVRPRDNTTVNRQNVNSRQP